MPRRDGTGPLGYGVGCNIVSDSNRGIELGIRRKIGTGIGQGFGCGIRCGYGRGFGNNQGFEKMARQALEKKKAFLEARLKKIEKQLKNG